MSLTPTSSPKERGVIRLEGERGELMIKLLMEYIKRITIAILDINV